jgi:hypothetical protein
MTDLVSNIHSHGINLDILHRYLLEVGQSGL